MKFGAFSTAAVALSLIAASGIAVAQPVATPLTDPSGAETDSGTGKEGYLMAGLAAVFLGIGIVAATDSGSGDRPNSP